MKIEQGLGLPIGTTYPVPGFTDLTSPDGFTAMAFLSIDPVVIIITSDSAQNGNFLDDE
ncbi:MAG: hypothetical protein ACJA16_001837 [Akkermansiaceae bacterium]|jgi:hypothetical protein